MYKYKHRNMNKGYIIVYILLVCSLCMVLVSYSFHMEISKSKNLRSYKDFIVKARKIEEYKEHLFTYLHKEINLSITSPTSENVREYLTVYLPEIRFDGDKACIRYDSITDRIFLETYTDAYNYRRDIYEYKVVSNEIKYSYLDTKNIEGRME
jgi:hypothetical protein